MTTRSASVHALARHMAAAALVFVSAASSPPGNAESTVYRCKDASGTVSYQDYACKGGVAVEIKPDAADPAAIQRLQREQADFDRAAARRKAREEVDAVRREALNQRRSEFEAAQRLAEQAAYGTDAVYGPAYVIGAPEAKARMNRSNLHRRAEHRRFVNERRVPAVIRRPHPD